jgi:hypothetical protein
MTSVYVVHPIHPTVLLTDVTGVSEGGGSII